MLLGLEVIVYYVAGKGIRPQSWRPWGKASAHIALVYVATSQPGNRTTQPEDSQPDGSGHPAASNLLPRRISEAPQADEIKEDSL